ncbi:MAG: CAP domain-containing protein [Isosphaeraceae bacterium]
MKRFAGVVLGLLVVTGLACSQSAPRRPARPVATKGTPGKAAPKVDTTPGKSPPSSDLVAVINEVRKANGVGPVWELFELDQAARLQADWQAQTDTLRHDGPPTMPTWLDRLKVVGVESDWQASGEICAQGQKAYWPDTGKLAIDYTFRDACRGWLNSPGHRAILLGSQFTHAGAQMSVSPQGRIYSTTVFLRRVQ